MTQVELGATNEVLALDLLADHLDILWGCDMIAWVKLGIGGGDGLGCRGSSDVSIRLSPVDVLKT